MKTILHNSWLYAAVMLLALGGCKSEQTPRAYIFPENGVSNPNATLFLEHLQKQDAAYKQFAKSLAGHIPLYEGTTIAGTAQFGYCYIIPYINSDSVVCGAIYYSMLIDSLPERVDVFPLSDYPLGHLENIDEERLYNEYTIYNGYLLSLNFRRLKEKGYRMPQELVEFAEVLDGASIPNPSKEYHATPKVKINNRLRKCKSLADTLRFLEKEFVESNRFVGKPAGVLFDAYKSMLPITRAFLLKASPDTIANCIPLGGVRICYNAEGAKAPAVYMDVYFDNLQEDYYEFQREIPVQNHIGNRRLYYVINMKVSRVEAYIHTPAVYGNLTEFYQDSVYLSFEGNLHEPEVIWGHQDIYVPAYERMRQHLHFEGDTLNWDFKSAEEIKVSENIYEYVTWSWSYDNNLLRTGDYVLSVEADGYYMVKSKK